MAPRNLLPTFDVGVAFLRDRVHGWKVRDLMNADHSPKGWLVRPRGAKRVLAGLICLLAVLAIGFVDYWADYRVQFTALYLMPIGYATIFVGRWYAIILALLSVVVATAGDVLANAPSPLAIRAWNDCIVLSLLILVTFLLDALYKTLLGLESIVEERTQALRREMDERQRLERETLDLSERERQAFGHELHDVICQDLAGLAIASHLLVKKLEAQHVAESGNAREIAGMVERALDKARSVARGFFTSGFDVMGLAEALREIAQNVQDRSGVRCAVHWQDNLVISNDEAVIHLFRIAQEAIQNAVKHGKPSHIGVSLLRKGGAILLTVEDDGRGIKPDDKSGRGLGLRIMSYRANLIGGELKIERPESRGTRIVCTIPVEKVSAQPQPAHVS